MTDDLPTVHDRFAFSMSDLRGIVIMPALNEEESIAAIVSETQGALPEFNVVVVDDGSSDQTAVRARGAGAVVLSLPFNLGIGGAVQAGFRFAAAECVDVAVQIDGDGQHVPGEVRKLLEPIARGEADVVVGSRYLDGGTFDHPVHRRFLIRVFALLVTAATGRRFTDTSSSFRAYNRKAIRICAEDYPHGFLESVESLVTLSRYGIRVAEVPVIIRARSVGKSSLSLGRTMAYSVKVTIAIVMALLRSRPRGRVT